MTTPMKTHAILLLSLVTTLSSFAALAAQPFCVAHRSLGYGGLENSLEAFENASKAHAKAIEFDLLHTKDGKTIVHHDNKLGRVTLHSACSKIKIQDLTLREIQEKCRLKNGEKIPTFDEALNLLSQYDSVLFIEFKDKMITENDFYTIEKYYSFRPEKIIIISFLNNILMEVEKKKENNDFFKSVRTLELKKLGFNTNIDNFDGISAKFINKSHVGRLQNMGKLVGAYTKDSGEKIQKYLDKGVDFITTNNSPLCESLIVSGTKYDK